MTHTCGQAMNRVLIRDLGLTEVMPAWLCTRCSKWWPRREVNP